MKQTTTVNIEAYSEYESKPTFIYSADSLLSPFQRPRNTGAVAEKTLVTQPNCTQPDFNRSKQPLEKFGVDALSINGIFQSNGK